MKITVEVPSALEDRLATVSQRLNLSAESLAEVALRDLLERTDDDFERAAAQVLEKNHELYRRLA